MKTFVSPVGRHCLLQLCPWEHVTSHNRCALNGVSCELANSKQPGNEVSCRYELLDAITVHAVRARPKVPVSC